MTKTILLIFLGGGLGSVSRYVLGNWISRIYQNPFPLGTLVVNLVACLLVGLLAGLVDQRTQGSASRAFLIVGFCGGFSTFSTFTSESAQLMGNSLTGQAILYVCVSLFGCLAATFLGLWLAGRA